MIHTKILWMGAQTVKALRDSDYSLKALAEYFISFIIELSSQVKILTDNVQEAKSDQPTLPSSHRLWRISYGNKQNLWRGWGGEEKICPDRPESRKACFSDLRTHLFVTFYYPWSACTFHNPYAVTGGKEVLQPANIPPSVMCMRFALSKHRMGQESPQTGPDSKTAGSLGRTLWVSLEPPFVSVFRD